MEILSPAGSPDSLPAAVKAGADAVYLAGKGFGARAFAGNFSDSELEGAVGYAHDHGVKVHVTVNTLIKNSEMEEAVSFVRFLADIGADAVIVQDLGLLKCLSRIDIPKHASTQMQIHSAKGLEWCSENGLDRAVLARELTMEELSEIIPDSPVETEVFIQGALCYCISGGCLMSSHIGGRSGNRGSCAQPCRKRYVSGDREGYLLSCADLYGIDYIEDLRKLGTDSLKIEGRMRSPAYAYLATKAYSMAEKGLKNEEFYETLKLLRTVFNRGICSGYLGPFESPVQSGYPDNRGFYMGEVQIRGKKFFSEGLIDDLNLKDGITLFSGDEKAGGFKVADLNPTHVPFSIRDGNYSLYRTYDPRIDVIKNLIGETPAFKGSSARAPVSLKLQSRPVSETRPQRSFYVSAIKTLETVLPYADRIYFDNCDKIVEAREMCARSNKELVALLPRFDPLDDFAETEYPVMVNTPGQYHACRKSPRIYASSNMNFFNSYFPLKLYQATLSTELSRREISDLVKHSGIRTEVMVFGRMELMVTRDPGMDNCVLKDEKDISFPVYRDRYGYSRILNSADLNLIGNIGELGRMGVDSVGFDLRKRPPALARAVCEACVSPASESKLEEICGGFTRGLYQRGV